MKTQISLTIPN